MGVWDKLKDLLLDELLTRMTDYLHEKKRLDALEDAFDCLEREFEVTYEGTIVSDGAFYECIKNCHILYRLIEYVENNTGREQPTEVFLQSLLEDILDRISAYTTKSLNRRDRAIIERFLLKALSGVESHFYGELSPQNKFLAYIVRRWGEPDGEIRTSLDALIDPQGSETAARCDIYRSVEVSAKLPPLKDGAYYLQYIRAGKDEWNHHGDLENNRCLMQEGPEGEFSVVLESVPVNLGFQFKCLVRYECDDSASAIYETLQRNLNPQYRSSGFSDYHEPPYLSSSVSGADYQYELIDLPVAQKKELFFVLPGYPHYIAHPYINNYFPGEIYSPHRDREGNEQDTVNS